MGALIFGACFAGFFLLVPLLSGRRQLQQVEEADDQRLADLRWTAEVRWFSFVLAAWALTSATGGVALLLAGRSIGWGWLGVAVVYASAIATHRRASNRLLSALGDRGARARRGDRYRSRARTSHLFAALGFAGYVASSVLASAFVESVPPWAEVADRVFTGLLFAGLLAFGLVRLRMYLAGDDLAKS